jgi:hypothetical protein
MIMRWISDVPSKIVKLVEVRAVSAGRCPVNRRHVSTNSARGRSVRGRRIRSDLATATAPLPPRRLCWRNVVVPAEQVRWVVDGLQFGEPGVVLGVVAIPDLVGREVVAVHEVQRATTARDARRS